tara:strand:- start:615 stop:1397 length:783 start_codon:yes stop_codon:yes gene_type:complete
MVNHARTLLMNVDGATRPAIGYLGEEYIPATFPAVNTPTAVTKVHDILFGLEPDYVFMNYRAAELMRLLHSTELKSYVTDLDPRITYDNGDSTFFDMIYGSTINTVTDDPNLKPAILERYAVDNIRGRMYDNWDVVLSGGTVTTTNMTTGHIASAVFSLTSNISPRYSLPDSGLSIIFTASGALTGTGRWVVTTIAKPTTLSTMEESIRNVGGEYLSYLFDGAAPYSVFKSIWNQHELGHYRLAAAVLAVIYRTEQIRNG